MPTLAAKLYKSKGLPQSPRQIWWQTGISVTLLTKLYRQSIKWTTARPLLGIGLALLLPLTGFIQAGSLAQQFFPAADRDQLQVQLELPATTSITQTQAVTKQIRDRLLAFEPITDNRKLIKSAIAFGQK